MAALLAFVVVPYLLQVLLVLCIVLCVMLISPPPQKRRRIVLTLDKKREIIGKMEEGWSIPRISREYEVPTNTLYDLRKSKEKIKKYQQDFGKTTSKKVARKVISKPKHAIIDESTLVWYRQQRAAGVLVRGTEVKNSAKKFARLHNINDFQASEGWLFRFKLRHGLCNKKTHGEALDASEEGLEDFRHKFQDLVDKEGLIHAQIYNADETGLFYRSTPTNTLADEHEKNIPGRKLSKQRISALCCANASGLHRLKQVIVGKAKQPRCLRGMMDHLPVIWYNSTKAWFNIRIFSDWFHRHFVPEVIRYQTQELGIARDRVKALLLLDNAPAHPAAKELIAENGRIRVLYLPPNSTAILQPMDQGVIVSAKRHYRRKFLDEVMVVLEDDEEKRLGLDTRGQRTRENLKNYNIKSAIYNWANAWKAVPPKTLENGWSRIMKGIEAVQDFTGFELKDFQARFREGGDVVEEDDIREWLDDDGGDPGYQTMSDAEIAASSTGYVAKEAEDSDGDDSDDADGSVTPDIPRLSHVRDQIDGLLSFIEHPDVDRSLVPNDCAEMLRNLRDNVICRQNRRTYKQSRLNTFFRPQTPSQRTPSVTDEPQPSTSATPEPSTPEISPMDVTLDLHLASSSEGTPSPAPTPLPLAKIRDDFEGFEGK